MWYDMEMPKIDIEKVPVELRALVAPIIASRGKNKGCLRASKPPIPAKVRVEDPEAMWGYTYRFEDEAGQEAAKSAYIWRMVAFYASPIRKHHSQPITCEWELDGSPKEARELCKELDVIVEIVLSQIPIHKQHGLMAWGKALGYL